MRDSQRDYSRSGALVLALISLIVLAAIVQAGDPLGATITYIGNSTKPSSNGSIVNYSGGGQSPGGYIFWINLSGTQQDSKWKGFVGNVTGKLTLDDASGNTLFDWSITGSPLGRVYSTRQWGSINWSWIKCANRTVLELENSRLSQTGVADNISATFSGETNSAFSVGTVPIAANECPTINTYVNDSSPTTDDFEEMVLFDGPPGLTMADAANMKNIVFATILEQDAHGFDHGKYDFQMIVPEVGLSTWTSSTAYYFYVELN